MSAYAYINIKSAKQTSSFRGKTPLKFLFVAFVKYEFKPEFKEYESQMLNFFNTSNYIIGHFRTESHVCKLNEADQQMKGFYSA